MIANNNLSSAEREFIVQIRSLLLKVVDLIDRRYCLGKYRPSKPANSSTDSIAGIIESAARVEVAAVVKQKG
jgi:hypothetical protein